MDLSGAAPRRRGRGGGPGGRRGALGAGRAGARRRRRRGAGRAADRARRALRAARGRRRSVRDRRAGRSSDGPARLVAGEESLARLRRTAGWARPARPTPPAVVAALRRADPAHARAEGALSRRGAPCAFEVRGAGRRRRGRGPRGRRAGLPAAVAAAGGDAGLPTRRAAGGLPRRARHAGLDRRRPTARRRSPTRPGWRPPAPRACAVAPRTGPDVRPRRPTTWPARRRRPGERREAVRWAAAGGRRRAFRLTAQPLEGGGVGVWSEDVTEAEEAAESLKRARRGAGPDPEPDPRGRRRSSAATGGWPFNNAAFAELWGLEPAWLAERPSHGELLDRLRQRRRLPETRRLRQVEGRRARPPTRRWPPAEDLWRLPDAPHAAGRAPAAPLAAACCCCSPTSPTS